MARLLLLLPLLWVSSSCLSVPVRYAADADAALTLDLRQPSSVVVGGKQQRDGLRITVDQTAAISELPVPVSAKSGTLELRLLPAWPATKGKHTLAVLEFESGTIRLERAETLICLVAGVPDDMRWANASTALTGWGAEWHELALTWNYADGYTAIDFYADGTLVSGLLAPIFGGELQRVTLGGDSVDPEMAIIVSDLRISTLDRLRGGHADGAVAPPTARLLGTGATGAVWYEDAARQVRPRQAAPTGPAGPSIGLTAAANEFESFQVVVTPAVQGELRVQVEDFDLPVTIRHAEYVEVARPSGRYGAAGLFPDPLPLVKGDLPLEAGVNTILWFTVEVPPGAKPGLHRGAIRLSGAITELTIPLSCRVRSFALPAKPSLQTMSNLWLKYAVAEDKSGATAEALVGQYAGQLSRHRGTVETHSPIDNLIRPGKIDKAALADRLDFWFNTCGFSYVTVHPLGWISHLGTHKWPDGVTWKYNGEPFFLNEATGELNPAFTEPFRAFWKEAIAAFDELGYTDRLLLWYQDEQSWDDPPTLRKSVAMARFLKSLDSRPRILQSKYPHAELLPYTDIWCIHGDHLPHYAKEIAAARRHGSQIWTYANAVPLIDYPAIRTRMLPWALWKQRLDGSFCWWAVSYYVDDPWRTPWKYLAGSGVLIYPSRDASETFPIPSIRWELLREGLEDYEYLALLQRRLEAATGTGKIVQQANALLAEARAMTNGIPKANAGDQPYNQDPAILNELRNRLGDTIEALGETP